MFCVIFEVLPKPERLDDYLTYAEALRPELVRVDGFIDNLRYRSRRRDGWLLSLSTWRDEKALVQWRTNTDHRAAQAKGRSAIFQDYEIRVGQVTADSQVPPGQEFRERGLDGTGTGAARIVSILEARGPSNLDEDAPPDARLGRPRADGGLVAWDMFDAITAPGHPLLLVSCEGTGAAEAAERTLPPDARRRRVRVVRDYGLSDRREAPAR